MRTPRRTHGEGRASIVEAIYHDGQVWILADGTAQVAAQRGIAPEQRAAQLVPHELVHHSRTLESLFPAEAQKPLENFTEFVLSRLTSADRAALGLPQYQSTEDTHSQRLRQAGEILARYAETANPPTWWHNAAAMLKGLLRRYIPGLQWSDAEVRSLLGKMREDKFGTSNTNTANPNGPATSPNYASSPDESGGSASDEPRRPVSVLGRFWQELARDPATQIGGNFSNSTDLQTLLREFAGPAAEGIRVEVQRDENGDPRRATFHDSEGGRIRLVALDSNTIFLDSFDSKADGTQIYQTVYAWAHNTGRVVIGDPTVVLPIATLRRASHMFSSALRFNTARHLLPDPSQIEWMAHDVSLANRKRIAVLDELREVAPSEEARARANALLLEASSWRTDDSLEATTHNIGLLARAEMRLALDRLPELKEYSYWDGTFYHKGRAIAAPERDSVLERAIAELDSKFEQGVGSTTLARVLATYAADTGGNPNPNRSPSHKGIRYSIQPDRDTKGK